MCSYLYLYLYLYIKNSHRDGFSLHEENSSLADDLLDLLEKPSEGGNRRETVPSQPMLEGSEKGVLQA